jgi:protein tyrosine/serine phosphatase
MKIRKLHVVFLILVFPASVLLYFGLLQIDGNFHTVAAGKLYRSAQPSAGDLAVYARTLGIKSVINLRGQHQGEPWYDDEMRVSNELGLFHADIALSARRELSAAQLSSLEKALRDAPAPILIHCKSGADRTGLAAALYVLEVLHLPVETASAQLSWVYGHWPYLGSGSAAMDRTFEHVAAGMHSEGQQEH